MFKTILIILMLLVTFGTADAVKHEAHECSWFWTTSFASTTEDSPDYVYCRTNGGSYQTNLTASSYAQFAAGADDVSVTYDTDIADGSTTVGDLLNGVTNDTVICSNATAFVQLNVHASANESQYSEGGLYYYQLGDGAATIADEDANTFGMTPTRHFKFTATEGNGDAACMVIHSTVTWLAR